MTPPPTSPCSPSLLMPTSEKLTSARSSSSARACPRAPTAGATARPSLLATRTRVAARLRAVEQAYRMANERDAVFRPPEHARALRSPEHAANKEIELE